METDKPLRGNISDFYTFITHQDGTRFYMINYFFFLKIEKNEFEKTFHTGPLKSFMKLENIGTEKFLLDEKAEKKINEQLQICQILINDDYMIIPFCASLITKFPFIEQIQICLDKLVKMLFNSTINEKDIFLYIQYLIKGIVIPSPNKNMVFYLPWSKHIIIIVFASFFKKLNMYLICLYCLIQTC